MTLETRRSAFINKANKKYNRQYDYTDCGYTTNTASITIMCPIHGEFIRTPSGHLKLDSNIACPGCRTELPRTPRISRSEMSADEIQYELAMVTHATDIASHVGSYVSPLLKAKWLATKVELSLARIAVLKRKKAERVSGTATVTTRCKSKLDLYEWAKVVSSESS